MVPVFCERLQISPELKANSLKKEQRQSIRKKLEQAKERVAKHREITKEKTKDRGQVR